MNAVRILHRSFGFAALVAASLFVCAPGAVRAEEPATKPAATPAACCVKKVKVAGKADASTRKNAKKAVAAASCCAPGAACCVAGSSCCAVAAGRSVRVARAAAASASCCAPGAACCGAGAGCCAAAVAH